MRKLARGALLPLTMVLGLCVIAPAHADSLEPFEEFGNHVRAAQQVTPLSDSAFGDEVSLYNGATSFEATDISIPGNNALPVTLGRRFAVQARVHDMDPGNLGGFGDWDMEVPYIEAEVTAQNGWTLNGGSSNRCSDTTDLLNTRVTQTYWVNLVAPLEKIGDGYQLHIPGSGEQELLVNNQGASPAYPSRSTYPWVTTGNWKLSCNISIANPSAYISGEGFKAISPSGVTYTFNWAVVNPAPSVHVGDGTYGGTPVPVYADRERIYLLATQVQDRFGNTVSYSYDGNNHLTSITSSDNPGDTRTITLTWNSAGNIASASDGTHTWSYGYSTNTQGTVTTTILTSVTEPDTSQWTYAYSSGSLVTSKNPQCN